MFELKVVAIIVIPILFVVLFWFFSLKEVRPFENDETIARMIQLLEKQEELNQSGRVIGLIIIVSIVVLLNIFWIIIYGYINILLPNYFMICLYAVISRLKFSNNHRVLLLRPFNVKFKMMSFKITEYIGYSCRGLAIPFTVQDKSFKRQYPLELKTIILSMFILIPFIFYEVSFLALYNIGLKWFFSIILCITIILSIPTLYFIVKLANNLFIYNCNFNNFNKTIHNLFKFRFKGIKFYNGIRVLKNTVDIWKDSVLKSISLADAIVIDLSNITENILWEIKNVFILTPPEAVILCWYNENIDDKIYKNQLRQHDPKKLIFDNRISFVIPQHIVTRLGRVVSPDMLEKCNKFVFWDRMHFCNHNIIIKYLSYLLSSAIAHRELSKLNSNQHVFSLSKNKILPSTELG